MKKSDGVDAIQRKILLAKRKLIYEIEKAKKDEEDEKRGLLAMRNKMHKLKKEALKKIAGSYDSVLRALDEL